MPARTKKAALKKTAKAKKAKVVKKAAPKAPKAAKAACKPVPASKLPMRVEVVYKGRVQGVGFRFCAEKAALECGVCGWVRNEHNGDVKLVAEGPEAILLQTLECIRQSPVGRHIRKESVEWSACRNEFCDFRIEYHFQ